MVKNKVTKKFEEQMAYINPSVSVALYVFLKNDPNLGHFWVDHTLHGLEVDLSQEGNELPGFLIIGIKRQLVLAYVPMDGSRLVLFPYQNMLEDSHYHFDQLRMRDVVILNENFDIEATQPYGSFQQVVQPYRGVVDGDSLSELVSSLQKQNQESASSIASLSAAGVVEEVSPSVEKEDFVTEPVIDMGDVEATIEDLPVMDNVPDLEDLDEGEFIEDDFDEDFSSEFENDESVLATFEQSQKVERRLDWFKKQIFINLPSLQNALIQELECDSSAVTTILTALWQQYRDSNSSEQEQVKQMQTDFISILQQPRYISVLHFENKEVL